MCRLREGVYIHSSSVNSLLRLCSRPQMSMALISTILTVNFCSEVSLWASAKCFSLCNLQLASMHRLGTSSPRKSKNVAQQDHFCHSFMLLGYCQTLLLQLFANAKVDLRTFLNHAQHLASKTLCKRNQRAMGHELRPGHPHTPARKGSVVSKDVDFFPAWINRARNLALAIIQ